MIKKNKSKNKSSKIISGRDQYIIVLEDIRSQNKVIAKMVLGLNEKFGNFDKKFYAHFKDFEGLRVDVELIKGEVARLERVRSR